MSCKQGGRSTHTPSHSAHLVLIVDVRNCLLRRLVLVCHQVLGKNVLEVAVDDVFQLRSRGVRLHDFELPLHALAVLGFGLLLHGSVPAQQLHSQLHYTTENLVERHVALDEARETLKEGGGVRRSSRKPVISWR